MQSCVSSTKFFKAITIHIIILLSLIITTEEKNKYQYVSQNEGGGGEFRKDSREIKTGEITRKYHISPSIRSTFLKDTQKIKKCTNFN